MGRDPDAFASAGVFVSPKLSPTDLTTLPCPSASLSRISIQGWFGSFGFRVLAEQDGGERGRASLGFRV